MLPFYGEIGMPIQNVLINPFENNYLKPELTFYKLTEYDNHGIKVISPEFSGRCDEYLNKAFHINVKFPVMYIDGKLWMSLSFSEIQSHYLAIKNAKGIVGTGGLGLGYFTLRVASKDDVERVDVYEINPKVIQFFKDSFSRRKCFKKINFIEGDVREKIGEQYYNFFFMDIYPVMELDQQLIDDIHLSYKYDTITNYHFWGQERVLLAACNLGYMDIYDLTSQERQYFSYWFDSGKKGLYDNDIEWCNQEMIEDCLSAMGRI